MKFQEVEKEIIKKAFNLDRYIKTLEIDKVDFNNKEKIEEYQTNFNTFYKIRRNKKWRQVYYSFLEKNKNNIDITFEEIITYLYNNTEEHNVEASFSSKLLATINPDKPIWDEHVLKYIFTKKEINKYKNKKNKEIKMKFAMEMYSKIEKEYEKKLKDKENQNTINELRKVLNEKKMTNTKILDYIIWTLMK